MAAASCNTSGNVSKAFCSFKKRMAFSVCACFDPAVSKSGLSHRMKKLESLADTLRQRLEQEAEEVKA